MSESISAFDGDYVRLGRVAALLAQERQQCAFEDVMDLLKRSVFTGEFDGPSFEFGEARENPSYWLHMEIEAPRCLLPPDQAALSVRPKQLYGVNRSTVCSRPTRCPAEGSSGNHCWTFSRRPTRERGFSALVAIPFRDFPERGRRELEALLIPIEKLVPWLGKRGWTLPGFLSRAAAKGQGLDEITGLEPSSPEAPAPGARPAGRPPKRAWPRVVELVRQLAKENPDWQKKDLAYQARRRASQEFSENELPSVATIQRHMANILGGGSG